MEFRVTENDDGVLIRHNVGLLRLPRKTLPPEQWVTAGSGPVTRAMGRIQTFLDVDGAQRAEVRGQSLFLSSALVAELEEADAAALGLPPAAPFGIRLSCKDQVKSNDFRVVSRWVRGGGISVAVKREGAILRSGGKKYRITEPAFTILELAKPLADELPEPERLAAYAALSSKLSQTLPERVERDGYLDEVTVYHAAAFSISLGVAGDDFDFDPILFAREVADEAQDGASVDEVEAALLPPSMQKLFSEDRFRRYADARSAYPLKDGSFVVIDPSLKPALSVVRQVSSADRETRRAFISNPSGFVRDRVPEDYADTVAELFIETEQFSERITGVDIWKTPVLPWVKPSSNSWIPERFGLKIGDGEPVSINPEEVAELRERFDEAVKNGEDHADWSGSRIPTTSQADQSIKDLEELSRAIDDSRDVAADDNPEARSEEQAPDGPPPVLENKLFLTVQDNFEDVAFTPAMGPGRGAVSAPEAPPDSVRAQLKSYQLDGFRWLALSNKIGFPGVLLADDMGLGKTLQTLAFMAHVRAHQGAGERRPILVVAPTGLLGNWRDEIERHLEPMALGPIANAFGADLRRLKEHPKASTDIKVGRNQLDVEEWRSAGVVFTTYETLRDYHFSFARLRFAAVVFDEIQKLKNPTSQVSRSARTLNADFKVGLTGTPVENRLQDLWSIMDVLWPGYLGSSKEFEKRYPPEDQEKLEELHNSLFQAQRGDPPVPVGLRRMKLDRLDGLPSKTEKPLQAEMPETQASAYADVIARARAARDTLSPGDGMLKVLHQLRSISLHPRPPSDGYDDMDAYVSQSARLSQARDILDGIHQRGEKVLLFLEALEMQEFMSAYIQKRFGLSEPVARIHGQVPGARRQALVNAFQSKGPGFDAMILSPKAGGVGLTLTAANHVIHLSRWWNPAVEDQSTDRVFRIGQDKPVSVYLPMAVHPSSAIGEQTFDVKLNALLKRKRELSARMLLPPDGGATDAQGLFDDLVSEPLAPPRSERQDPAAEADDQTLARAASMMISLPDDIPALASVRVLSCPEGTLPDPSELFTGMRASEIDILELIDPYGLAGRSSVGGLAKVIIAAAKTVGRVHEVRIHHLPDGSISNADFEVQDALHRLRAAITKELQSVCPPPRVRHFPRRRKPDSDFHDRYVKAHFKEAGEPRLREINLSRGFDAITRKEFNIKIFVEPDRSIDGALPI